MADNTESKDIALQRFSSSQIDKLIAELCPEGVEFKALGKVAEIKRGTSITKKAVVEGNVPVIAGGRTPAYYHNASNRDGNTIVIAGSGVYAGFVSWWEQPIFVSDAFSVKPHDALLAKYCYYWLHNIQQQLHELKSGGGVPHVYPRNIGPLLIPIPPLAIQQEIVKILDTFTTLEAELEAELAARKKQYEYYRDELLTFGDDVEWKTLEEICNNVSSGGTPLSTKTDYYGGDIPWLRTQEVRFVDIYDTEVKITEKGLKNSSAKWIPENCVIVAISGATAARTAINKIPMTTNQHCCNLEINSFTANYRYVFHWVSCQYEKLKVFGQGARADLNSGLIKNFPIPIPPLAEQKRIVAILDKFDTLVNDISVGLPAEIAARRKQYEYYREKLLTFKESPTEKK